MVWRKSSTNNNDKFILTKAPAVNQAVQAGMPDTQLRIEAIRTMQAKAARDLQGCGRDDISEVLHRTWSDLNHGRMSAACSYEWARWNVFNVGYILPVLRAHEGRFWLVTIADRRWRCAPDDLSPASIERVKRKVKASMAKLTAAGFKGLYYAVFEVCVAVDPDGSVWFEPHSHIIIAGSNKSAIKAAFHVRQTKADRKRFHPLHVTEISREQLGNTLGYMSKRRPQTRSGYIGDEGRTGRQQNKMSTDLAMLWHDLMADMPMRDLFMIGGFDREVHDQFRNAEMASLLERIL